MRAAAPEYPEVIGNRTEGKLAGRFFPARKRASEQAASVNYSVITVDCPEISNRLRQRMFLQAIMSSLRTM